MVTLLFSIGAVVARGNFLSYALIFATVMWLITQILLFSIAAYPEGRPDIGTIALANAPALIVYWVAATIGAFAGGRYYAREFDSSDTARRQSS